MLVAGDTLPSERHALSRERIVDAAIAYIDAQGLPGLTMRRLGQLLGVEAMSLYRYVQGKEHLLDAVVESLAESMSHDDEVVRTPRNGWQDFLQRLAHGIRRIALEHPKAFPLIASRPAEAPWLRPPLRNLQWVENFLNALISEGFSDAATVAAYRAFTSFMLGHLLLEVATLGADVGPLDVLADETADGNGLHKFPTVDRLQSALSENHAAAEFEESLENLLDRLQVLLSEQGTNLA